MLREGRGRIARGKGEAESFPLREGKGVVRCGSGGRLLWKRFGNRFSFRSWRWELEVKHGGLTLPLSTLLLQLEQAFVDCPLSFVRESLVALGRRLTRQRSLGKMGAGEMTWGQASAGCPRIFTNHTNFVRIRENSC